MSKTICFITIYLGLLALVIVIWNWIDISMISKIRTSTKNNRPTYQSGYTQTLLYNSTGKINYKLVADHVDHFSEKQITWFIKLVFVIFDEKTAPVWEIKADKANLIQDKIIYLHGHVQADNLTGTQNIKSISANDIVINLVTQDFSSENPVTLYGVGFKSTSMKMRGNLSRKTAELIEKVNISYEIHNS